MSEPIPPTWSLPPCIAMWPRLATPPPSHSSPASSPAAASSSSRSTSGGVEQAQRESIRFPVAPKGQFFDRATIASLYTLPHPNYKFSRVDKQHAIHVRNIDGLYYPKDLVRHILRPEPGKRKAVLDLAATGSYLSGGGGGNWPIDLALEFPHVDVVGLDDTPHPNKRIPPNCRFEQDDYTASMPHHHGRYDIVHARTIATSVKDYPAAIAEMSRCLKPGGLILLADGDMQLLDHNGEPQDMSLDDGHNKAPRYSWLARLFFEVYNVFKRNGAAVDAGIMLESWLKKSPAFENVEVQKVHTPIGPWKTSANPQEHAKWQYTGPMMRENMIDFSNALRPVLLLEGYNPAQVDDWLRKIDYELKNNSVRMHARYYYAWAFKRTDYVEPKSTPSKSGPLHPVGRPGGRAGPSPRSKARAPAVPEGEEGDDELSDDEPAYRDYPPRSSSESSASSASASSHRRRSHARPHPYAATGLPTPARTPGEDDLGSRLGDLRVAVPSAPPGRGRV